jgi:hypothetical protein
MTVFALTRDPAGHTPSRVLDQIDKARPAKRAE